MQILSNHSIPQISQFPIKGFSEITFPIIGKAIHALVVKNLLQISLTHRNTLIYMYLRFGNLEAARHLFDGMLHRNEATWSTMISGYVKLGMFPEAIGLFQGMWEHGVRPNGFVLASVVTASTRSQTMLGHGTQIHGLVIKFGLLADVFVGSSLLHFYGSNAFLHEARQFFEEMPERNIVSWTSLMVGYSQNGEPEEAVKIYQQMRREGVVGNPNSLSTVISSCGLLEDEFLGLQVFARVIVSGLGADVSVANSLIYMFGSFGHVEDARLVFYTMDECDRISWNSIISVYSRNGFCQESLKSFDLMRRANVEPDSTTLSSLISACSSVDNLKLGKGIHGLVIKIGIDSLVCISNTLVTMYSISGESINAEMVFQLMPERDLISWNSMIASHVQNGQCMEALEFLCEMHCTRKEMNHVTFASALAACSTPEALLEGKMIHVLIVLSGFHMNLLVGNALVTMYSKCGATREAHRAFQTMPEKDLVTWNALIGGHVDNEEEQEAINIFNLMRRAGFKANYITMVNVLGACSAPYYLLKCGMAIHANIVLNGLDSDNYVKNSLLTMYAKCGDLDSSNFIFNELDVENSASWNAIIAANAHKGYGEEALKLFLEMHHMGLELDPFSLAGGLVASASLALLEEGQQIHNLIIKLGFESDLHLVNAIMDTYGKCGNMEDVIKMLPATRKMGRLSWNVLISGFARHGSFSKASEAFLEMVKIGVKPDYVTFVSLLSACNHAGLVDEGLNYFSLMSSEYEILPGIEHCVCIVDLLGRSGRLIDAERFINEMPVPPNDLIWRSLLAACRTHRDLELGKRAAKHLLALDPSDDSAYVLLSNVCAVTGQWQDVETIRNRMQLNNVKKKPACSWLKVKNEVSSFGMGNRSHPQAKQIYMKLEELFRSIKNSGYVAETSFVLHDMDEEQKEHNLWNHSEKLALAFGLINTPEGSTLRIFKNLRVCGDCHTVYKFVSRTTGREILLRDPYRFHHFIGGKCSCSDYW